jgi:hypothetical protein
MMILDLLAFNIQKKICDILESFFYNFKYEERKVHNMFSLILNFSFKNLCPIFFIGNEKNIPNVDEYDKNPYILCF